MAAIPKSTGTAQITHLCKDCNELSRQSGHALIALAKADSMLTSLSLSLLAHNVSDCKAHMAGWCSTMPMQVPSREPQHWNGSMLHLDNSMLQLAHDVIEQCVLTRHDVTPP